jgi:hypothetical protein
LYSIYGGEIAVSEICTKPRSVDATGLANHSLPKSNNRRERGEWGPCACVSELYIINEIEERVNILLRLFIGDCIASLEKLDVEVF